MICLLAFLVLGQEDETCSPPQEQTDPFEEMRKKQQALELPRAVEQKKYFHSFFFIFLSSLFFFFFWFLTLFFFLI